MSTVKHFRGIGRCIYCGARDGPFSGEHIIPKGLGGTWILDEASCAACAKITCAIEGVCLGRMWGTFRAVTRMSKSKRHLEEMPVTFLDLNKNEWTELVKRENSPAALSLPVFRPAKWLQRGPKPTGSHWQAVWVQPINWNYELQSRQYGRHGFCYGEIRPNEFARMIAKIAHSYAVATFGVTFIPMLAKLCVLSDFLSFPNWIGSTPMPEDKYGPDWAHVVGHSGAIIEGQVHLVIRVQLFAMYRAPIYHAVVGPWLPPYRISSVI
jgi:hypothetical protein